MVYKSTTQPGQKKVFWRKPTKYLILKRSRFKEREREREHLIVSWVWGSTLSLLLHFSLNCRNGQLHILVGLKGGGYGWINCGDMLQSTVYQILKNFRFQFWETKKPQKTPICYIHVLYFQRSIYFSAWDFSKD